MTHHDTCDDCAECDTRCACPGCDAPIPGFDPQIHSGTRVGEAICNATTTDDDETPDDVELTETEFDMIYAAAADEPVVIVGYRVPTWLSICTADTFTVTCTCGVLSGGARDIRADCEMHGSARWQQ